VDGHKFGDDVSIKSMYIDRVKEDETSHEVRVARLQRNIFVADFFLKSCIELVYRLVIGTVS
jgi:hypothetical protein